jgi:hypothetical protein
MGTIKALTSQYGSAECSLMPCPGWDAEALFPSTTLRVEGNWSVGATAGGCRGWKAVQKRSLPPLALAAARQKPLLAILRALQRPPIHDCHG